MFDKRINNRKYGQLSAAAITAALILLCVFFYFRYDRIRTLHYALEKTAGDPLFFSEESGFYTDGFILTMERDPAIPEDIEIHYTTDGDIPTADSPMYAGGIDLKEALRKAVETEEAAGKKAADAQEETAIPSVSESRDAWRKEKAEMVSDAGLAAQPEEDGITVIPVRACLIQGEDRSRVVTRTYVIGPGVFERYSAYVACLTADSADLFDYDKGIMIKGSHYQEDLDQGKRPDRSGNYYHTGEEWTRDAHVTLFSPKGEVLLEEDGGLSVGGYSSRALPTKSLRMEAMPAHGSSGDTFHLEIFAAEGEYGVKDTGRKADSAAVETDSGTGMNAANAAGASQDRIGSDFRRLKFRTHGTPQIHIRAVRGEYAKILTDECGFPGLTENRLAVSYLNGEFYTMCDLAPTATKEYLCRLFGLKVPDAMEKYEGNDYGIFTQTKLLPLLTADLTKEENCARLEEAVDMDNYLFYYALEILLNNSDWPFNNIYMWRYLGEKDPANPYTDGRFRFVLDDMDQILSNDLHSMPEHWSTEVFDYLMKDEKSTFHHVMQCKKYRDTLLTYFDDLLQTAFEPEHACAILDDLYAQMEKEYRIAYGGLFWEEMEETAGTTKNNVRQKEALLRADIEKYLGLTDRYTVRIEAGEGAAVSWNNMRLGSGETWTNTYYRGTAFDVTAEPAPGYRIIGWEGTGTNTDTAGAAQTEDPRPECLTISDALLEADSAAEAPSVTVRAIAERIP